MTTRPLVSIITPVYNGEKYLEETLLSVFSQTYSHFELIVIDDGSPSLECEKICRKYSQKLKYISQANAGLSGARNRGLREAAGEYIAFIDQDDLWAPDKLEKELNFFETLRQKGVPVGLVYTLLIETNEVGVKIGRSSYSSCGDIFSELVYTNSVGTPSSVLVSKDAFLKVGDFDENIKSYSDWELFIRIARHYEIHCLPEYLTKYRIAHGSMSDNLELMEEDVQKITKKVFMDYPDFFASKNIDYPTYLAPIWKEVASIWKYVALRKLILYGDGPGFRTHIRRGWLRDKGVIGLMPWVYVALSYISIPLLRTLHRMKKKYGPRTHR